MTEKFTYTVFITGDIKDGFMREQVEKDFAQLFKISPEKAKTLLTKKQAIKKDLEHKQAFIYKKKIEAIGATAALKRYVPPKPKATPLALALEPMDEPHSEGIASSTPQTPNHDSSMALAPIDGEPISNTNNGDQNAPPADANTITCPKCNLTQAKQEQCENCGVYIHKLLAKEEANQEVEDSSLANEHEEKTHERLASSNEEKPGVSLGALSALGLHPHSLVIAIAVAFAGAFVWKIIAVQFGFELGLVAWGIGGAIGASVAMTGSRGGLAGLVCGILAVGGIVGGKYLIVENYQSEWSNLITQEVGEQGYRALYEEEITIANTFVNFGYGTEEKVRGFMVEYAYTIGTTESEVTEREIEDFKNYTVPRFIELINNRMSFEQWKQSQDQYIGQLSTVELMKENMGFLDILFLFLGVGTAFRLGRGMY